MQKIIELSGTKLEIIVRRYRRARNLRLSIHEDGSLRVSMPWRAGLVHVERFVREKSDWILDSLERVKALGLRSREEKRADYQAHRKLALMIATQKVAQFAPRLGVAVRRVSVRDQRTRWGSCSRSGTLCFNYRIALISSDLADYLVVHELCHLLEFNHSKAFWAQVERLIPNFRACRRALKSVSLMSTIA